MEWERAKNIILIAFILLNLGLASLIYIEDSQYTLTQDRIGNIIKVLDNNNIQLYTNLARRFAPMRHLDISGYYYDTPALLTIFFGDANVIQTEPEEGYFVFVTENDEDGRLEISNGFIYFDNNLFLSENNSESISREDAIKISDEFIQRHFADYVRDIVFDDYGGVRVGYCQQYRGQLIHTNFIEFFITADGIAGIELQFGRVYGYGAEPRMIFAPDEVLLTFMQRVLYMSDEPIFINNMDIVYFQEFASDREGSIYPAVPYYRIYTNVNDLPFLINAYTNELYE